MQNSKFILILKTFTKKELQQFEKFIISPIYNSAGIYVVRFYSELKKYYPDFDNESFTREKIYKTLYPGSKYNDTTFRKLSSEMMNLCEEFLIFKRFSEDKNRKRLLLLEELSYRKLDNLFEIRSKESLKLIEKDSFKDSEYYYDKFRLISIIKIFYFNRDRKKAIGYFDDEIENFINYFSLFMIHAYIERLKEKRSFTDIEFDMTLYDEVIGHVKVSDLYKKDAFKLFLSELQLYAAGEEGDYFELKNLKEKYYKKLPVEDLNSIYTTLVNYATERSENGRAGFLKEIFLLHKESLRRNITGEYFSEFQFINIVTVCLRLKENQFAENFIKKYPGSLNPEVRDNALNYCMANLSFAKKNFQSTLDHLLKVNFKYSQQKFLIKNLTLKTYYEQGEMESIYLLIDTYKHLLKREKLVPASIKDLLNNFINFARELADLKTGKGDRKEILNRVEKATTAEKQWLIEKLS